MSYPQCARYFGTRKKCSQCWGLDKCLGERDTPTSERAADPTPEALEAARKLLAEMCIEWNEQDDDCVILANALDTFAHARAEASVEKERERLLVVARTCARFRCRMTDDIPRCPDCGATVEGNDRVNGVCQEDTIRSIRADVIAQYLRGEQP